MKLDFIVIPQPPILRVEVDGRTLRVYKGLGSILEPWALSMDGVPLSTHRTQELAIEEAERLADIIIEEQKTWA